MLLNTTVIHCPLNVAGYANGHPDCSNSPLVVGDTRGTEH